MLLIVNAEIALPPTMSLALKFTALSAKKQLNLFTAYEVKKDERDYYYTFLKDNFLIDVTDEIVFKEDREYGIRIDTEFNYPLTIVKKQITFKDIDSIMKQLKVLEKISRQ